VSVIPIDDASMLAGTIARVKASTIARVKASGVALGRG
jgi:hypothetical protein